MATLGREIRHMREMRDCTFATLLKTPVATAVIILSLAALLEYLVRNHAG
jgi:hypothetical protein